MTNSSQISWVYYRRVGAANGPTVQPFPPGLRMIAGDATATSAQPLPIVKWLCGHGGPESPGIPNCTAPGMTGEAMMAKILFPSCWDGKASTAPTTSHTWHTRRTTERARGRIRFRFLRSPCRRSPRNIRRVVVLPGEWRDLFDARRLLQRLGPADAERDWLQSASTSLVTAFWHGITEGRHHVGQACGFSLAIRCRSST